MKYSAAPTRSPLQRLVEATVEGCTNCGKCVRDCAFLKKYGTPKSIAAGFDPTDRQSLHRPFECSLCGLCSAVCPEKLDLDGLFLEMRREAVDRDLGAYPEHKPLVAYEKVGTSRRFSLYRLPHGCKTVFFPGCSLPGTRPEAVHSLLALMQQADPSVGVVFDCCMKPSHSLGRELHASSMFEEMNDWLLKHGVQEVLVACPNCQVMFERYGHGLKVRTAWEALAESGVRPEPAQGTVTVHDPCVIRNAEPVHRAVRTLLKRQGLVVEEMRHCGKTTVCCGKGGAVNLLNPPLAAAWGELRKKEADGRRIITYCAGCVQALEEHTPANHLVDLLFAPQQTLAGKKKGAKAPITYLNRLRLKLSFKRKKGKAVLRERTYLPGHAVLPKKRFWRLPFTQVLIVAAAAGAIWFSV
ncbi:MAG TPA: (Fe-S)-binding protein [Geobacter sp.]|nr:(Fe-S)-binding protein [Geobacter sp.]